MYRAKLDRFTGRIPGRSLATGTTHSEVIGQVNGARELRSAVRSRGLNIVYQPVINLRSGKIVGMEALARWTTPSGTSVSPGEFIPMAEEAGLIGELGTQILTMAVRDAASWQSIAPTSVRINVSSQEMASPSFYDEAMRTIDKVGLHAGLLGLELPVSVLAGENRDVDATLQQLHAAGVSLMLDDLGAGYGSLAAVERLPVVDMLKVDRSCLSDDEPEGRAVVESVIALGHNLNLTVCAEGVENASQHARVVALGCDFGQGYYFARPTSREMVPQMLEAWAPFLQV